MIKVLHYVGKMDRGGMETFIMNLYRCVDKNEIQFDFAIHGDRAGEFENEIWSLGGRFFKFPHMRNNPIKYRCEWKKFWKEHKNEYLAFHFHTNFLANVIALEEAYKAKIPIRIVHAHSSYANKGKLQFLGIILHYFNQTKLRRIATDLFACSKNAGLWLFGKNKVDMSKIVIIKNAINLESFKFSFSKRYEMRKYLGYENEKVIGHIGSFLPVKNHDFLIDVISEAYLKDNSIRAVFIGDGKLRTHIEKRISESGLSEVIKLIGTRDDVESLLHAIDIIVMPSHYEGLPVSLIEAQSNGLPSLISTGITDEVIINSNVYKLPLSSSRIEWANLTIQILCDNIRCSDQSSLVSAGYDISDTARFYRRMLDR